MTDKKIKACLFSILNSSEFADASSYQRLLEYLVDATLNGISPKETSIGIEVFGKSIESASRNDTSVRVYVHNLRKKLDSYYLNDGKNDPVRLTIPKGHYKVQFVENNDTKSIDKKWLYRVNAIIILALVIINIFVFLYFTGKKSNHTSGIAKHPFWAEMFTNKQPVLLVFGDFYLFRDLSSQYGNEYVRNVLVNSPQDLDTLLHKYPEEEGVLIETDLTFLGKFSIKTLNNVLRLFVETRTDYEIKLASELTWDDLNSYNIIFIGPLKTMRLINTLLQNTNISHQIYPNMLFYHENESTFAYSAPRNHVTGYVRDYAIVTKLPGPSKNTIIIFSSTHDIGQISTIKTFTTMSGLAELDSLFSTLPNNYFEAVFEVQGYERTGFHPNLLHYNNLSPELEIISPEN